MHVFRAKTAGASYAETTRMARRLFVSPAPKRIVLPILAFSLMESFLLVYPALDGTRVLLGTLAIAGPAYVSALATVPLANRLGGRMYLRRSFLLSFVGLMLLGAFQLVSVVAETLYTLFGSIPYLGRIDRVAVLGYGAALWIREVILSATSNSQHLRSLPAASVHPILGLAGLAWFAALNVGDILLALGVLAQLPPGLVPAISIIGGFFLLYLAFTVIDLVIANVLLAMGLSQVTPTNVAIPFKLLLFVSLDGWSRLVHGLVLTYR